MCDHCSGTGTECNEDKHAEIPVPVPVRYMRTRKKTQTPVRKNCVDSYAPSITVQSALWKRTLPRAPEFAKHGPGALFQQHPLRCFPPSLGLPLWSVTLPSLAEAGRYQLLRKNQSRDFPQPMDVREHTQHGSGSCKNMIPSSLFSSPLHLPPFPSFSNMHWKSPVIASVATGLPFLPNRFSCSTVQTMPHPQSNPPAILFGMEL